MKIYSILALVLLVATTTFASANEESQVYEYVDSEGALHWIALRIKDKEITGDVTKYLDQSMKEKVAVGKFSGKVMLGKDPKNQRLSITFDENSAKALTNIVTDKKRECIWKYISHDKLIVPMFFFINMGYREDAIFRYLSPN
jgi:hypothetical protein